ncbi:hypothetical protein AGMMS49992_25550 [Clostridia bacterium]|nr:hypothetical protein AGMMS49992_25550 [Clostridia bacterium]
MICIAKCEVMLPEEFMAKLEGLGERVDEVIEKSLKAGGEVVKAAVSSKLASSIGKTKRLSRSTGELQGALGVSPVKVGREGSVDIHVGFAEPRRNGVANAMLANVLEFGKAGQPGHPFIKPAQSASKSAAEAAMAAVIDGEINNL